jgi:hypothetical protein
MAKKEDWNLRSQLGVTRRDLLRRGAIVGGALVFAVPAVQSIAAPAFAQSSPNPHHTCCTCKKSFHGFKCGTDGFTADACDSFCGGHDNVQTYATGSISCQCIGRPLDCSCT